MDFYDIPDPQDPRLAAFQNLRDRTLRGESLFIAEGDLVVERLLTSPFQVESLLVVERAWERVLPMLEQKVPERTPIYRVPFETVPDLVGFPFHQGVMAIGRREPVWTLKSLTEPRRNPTRRVILVLPDVTKPDNVGIVFRSAAALGADGVLLGEQACDPLSRRALRVSMGGVLQLPWFKSENIQRDLDVLRSEFGYTSCATVLSPTAVDVRQMAWPAKVAICFGNEYDGLKPDFLPHCDLQVTIPMAAGVDSLNLGTSAGIFLWELVK